MRNHTTETMRYLITYVCALLGNVRGHSLEVCEEFVPSLRNACLEVGVRGCDLLLELDEARRARSEFGLGHCTRRSIAKFRPWNESTGLTAFYLWKLQVCVTSGMQYGPYSVST